MGYIIHSHTYISKWNIIYFYIFSDDTMKLTKQETDVYRRYSKMNKSIHSCKIDQLQVHMNGEYEHELAKFNKFWELRKNGFRVITEAWQRGTDCRRDIVDLTNDEIWEVENSKTKRGNRHPTNINVIFYDTK